MRYETLITPVEKEKWLELGVTIGTDETKIAQSLAQLKRFLITFNEDQINQFKNLTSLDFDPNVILNLDNNPVLLKILLLKRFIDQHGLGIINEARSDLSEDEKDIFLKLLEDLFSQDKYPEDIYTYSIYRKRGTPNTWLKIVGDYTPDDIQSKLDSRIRSLTLFIHKNLKLSRKLRFKQTVAGLRIYMFTKTLDAKVILGANKNTEVQGGSFTLIIFDRENMKLGVVTGSKNEIIVIQRYLRKYLLPDSIGIPRADVQKDGKELLKSLLVSNPEAGVLLQTVNFQKFPLVSDSSPSLRLRVKDGESLDAGLNALANFWSNLRLDDLQSVDYQIQGKIMNAYVHGDEWSRTFINLKAKSRSVQLEESMLRELESRLGVNVKESRFIIEELTPEFVIQKIFTKKVVPTYPAIPEEAERIILNLINKRFIARSTLAKRRCQNCFAISWNSWKCPSCDRESMIIVGEIITIKLQEGIIMKSVDKELDQELPSYKVTFYPYKQRRNYKKGVIRLYNPKKNTSVFLLLISNEKDIAFAQDLLNEGFGVIGITDSDIWGKQESIIGLGCNVVPLHQLVHNLLNVGNLNFLNQSIEDQEQKIIERIFANLKASLDRVKNKPAGYDEDIFEVDIKNLVHSLVPDVIRLGTEYKGKSVPDGYCCYGFRNIIRRRKRRLFGWDAKYSFSSDYQLKTSDLNTQKKYIKWLTTPGSEPSLFGNLGIYAFISNFSTTAGFEPILKKLAESDIFPKSARLILLEDLLLVKICEWILEHWQQVLDNNSLIAETVFKWFKRKTTKPFNVLSVNDWSKLESRLNMVLSR